MHSIGKFGDKRLDKAGQFLYQQMIEQQSVCLRKLGGNRAGEVRLGRWIRNEDVKTEELITNLTSQVHDRVIGKHAVVLQDSTELNFQAHAKRVTGLGPVGNGKDLGMFMHPGLVLDADDKVCLGISAVKIWIRPEKKEIKNKILKEKQKRAYKALPIEEKESFRWIEVSNQSKEVLSQAKEITIIGDRESDIYEEFDRIPDEKTNLILRACRNRKLDNESTLFDYVRTLPVKGVYDIELHQRIGKRTAHKATLEIRFSEITIKKPTNCRDKNAKESITLYVVDVHEIQETVVEKEKPIHWCLLTTHKITTKEEALKIVEFYCLRWNIEQLFRTMKLQGVNVESSQIETGAGLMKLCAVALHVAVQTMQLTLAREGKDQGISVVFNEKECKVLAALQKKLEGNTQKQKNPHCKTKLSWASWTIARLGGWKGYKSESPPGPITMFRGLTKFRNIIEGYMLTEHEDG